MRSCVGVMACSRTGCDNVMCDRYSSHYGYLCWQCFNELISLGPEANVSSFMKTEKDSFIVNLEAAKARFEVEFPLTNN